MRFNRREWLGRIAAGSAGALLPFSRAEAQAKAPAAPKTPAAPTLPAAPAKPCPLALEDFQPRSMLHVAEHRVERARYPVIDVHAHFSWSGGLKGTETI